MVQPDVGSREDNGNFVFILKAKIMRPTTGVQGKYVLVNIYLNLSSLCHVSSKAISL